MNGVPATAIYLPRSKVVVCISGVGIILNIRSILYTDTRHSKPEAFGLSVRAAWVGLHIQHEHVFTLDFNH